ncbi:hypothetical protein AB1L05_17200 [Cytobacillus horneckiae]|uniref:hypothetical protein n=1 Tax=Cytobacillus horneckiae TaxID=549687 RepID=UPI0039A15E0F
MNTILTERFKLAKNYIYSYARPLEQARFAYHFENGEKERVITELKAYQNEDDGFGKAIEPDFWLPSSSPMATWAAGQILLEISVNGAEPIVKAMLSYLKNTCDMETGMWTTIMPENNDYPHAPWWHWQEGVQENWMYNPDVELAAFLVHWSNDGSKAAEVGWSSIQKALNYLMNKTEMDKHEINNFQKLVKLIKPFESIFNARFDYSLDQVSGKINGLAENCVDKDVENWSRGYAALPLDFIESPQDLLCKRLSSLVEKNLALFVKELDDEGVWDISWSWGSYPDSFAIARQYWKGILAVDRYRKLKAFGYLE